MLHEAIAVERLADGVDAAIHHVGRRDEIGAGVRVRERGLGDELQRAIVVDLAIDHDAAVSVGGVLAETDVGNDDEIRIGVLQHAHRLLDDATVRIRLGTLSSFDAGSPKSRTAGTPSERNSFASADEAVERKMVLRWHRWDLFTHVVAVHDEERIDEVGRRERGLANERAQAGVLAQAPEAREWRCGADVDGHAYSLRCCRR